MEQPQSMETERITQQSNPILAKYENQRLEAQLKKKEANELNLSEHEDDLEEEDVEAKFPVKGKFRMRAHINPLNDTPWPL